MIASDKNRISSGWKRISLNDLFEVDKQQIDVSADDFGRLPFIGMENIESHSMSYVDAPSTTIDEGSGMCFRFDDRHVLYGKLRPYLNKVFLPMSPGRCSMELLPLLPKAGFSREFVALVIQLPMVIEYAVKHSTGGRMPRANIAKLLKLEVPIPSKMEERTKLVDIFAKRISQMRGMRQAAAREKEAIMGMQTAILKEVFPLTASDKLPNGWEWKRVADLSKKIQYGVSLSSTAQPVGPKLLRITDIQDGTVNWDEVPYCDCPANEKESSQLEDGDIVFARTGATTGKSFLVKNPDRGAVFASYLIRVQCNKEKIRPEFLYLFFQSQCYWKQISKGSRGGTLAGFNATMLSELLVPTPRIISTQEDFVHQLEARRDKVQEIIERANKQLEAIEALPGAILREEFDFEKV